MKLIAASITALIAFTSFSQEEVVIIDRSKSSFKQKREVNYNDNVQAVKFAPLNLLAGEILFGYERQLSEKGSFDVELGPTISKIGFGINSHFGNAIEPQVDEISGMGLVFGIAYRYYPLDETQALNRFYVSPQFRFKQMNHKVQDFSGILTDVKRGNQVNTNFYFNFGYQFWPSKTFAMDLYAGIGIGMRTEQDFYSETFFNGTDWEYRWQEINSSGARYLFQLGLKIGIGSEDKN